MKVDRRSWREFQESGLLWWVNRSLHLFGWAIAMEVRDDGEPVAVYPVRISCRGFDASAEADGFRRLTDHMAAESLELAREVRGDGNGEQGSDVQRPPTSRALEVVRKLPPGHLG